MSFEIAGRVLSGDDAKRIDGLVSHDRLFNRGQALKRRLLQKPMTKVKTQHETAV